MGRKRANVTIEVERKEQYERGQRIKKNSFEFILQIIVIVVY